ncbi:conserved hypothetical protein [Histoplasma capsulatum G186AR]|uniref:Uncharacterized protein n=2 Tax=Ajellomyces capsulatus TaxID=5037 RepID=C0NAL8_AJECG|nr:uncharacterized protein HCBG_00164 [Histoplasma capsulatum G186AR]EEH10709.1 conserved hypothetical protein [Histoplasma capsulatum G186AR]KAG5288600.1 hypothetical protein I7I52_12130 [Histoplasma capsulatum]QSS71175.1 hypothetical protein I7I50_01916 [Histoplasma capsulatum G186AR]
MLPSPTSSRKRDTGQMTFKGMRGYTPQLLTSESLEGLEQAVPPGNSPSNSKYQSWKFDKPLPDIPRATSSVYSPDDEATGVIESHLPPCPRNTLMPEPPPRVPSRAHSLGSSEHYQKAMHEPPIDVDIHLRVPKKSLSLQPCGYRSAPNLLLETAAPASLSAPAGPYHPHYGWSWGLKSKPRSISTYALHGGSTTADPIFPISDKAIESVGPMLLFPSSGYHQCGKDESQGSSLAMVDDSGSEMCRSEILSERIRPRRYSEDVPLDVHMEHPQRTGLSSTGQLPVTRARNHRIQLVETQPQTGNRTELFSFYSDSSVSDHNVHITPTPNNTPTASTFARRRTKQLAVPISDYQRYGPKAWKTKRDHRPSTMFKRRMTKPKTKRASLQLPPLPPSPVPLRQYYQQNHRYSQSQSQTQCQSQFLSTPLTLLPRRMKTFLSKAFHSRNITTSVKPLRPPRPPSPSPMRYFLSPPPPPPPPPPPRLHPPTQQQEDDQWNQQDKLQQERQEQQQQCQQENQEKERSQRGGNLFRRSMAVTRERLGLGPSSTDVRKMTLKDRIVFVGPTDPAAVAEDRVDEWV